MGGWMAHRGVAMVLAAALAGGIPILAAAADPESPSPAASVVPGVIGATTQAWRDDFSAPTTWETGTDETGTTAYEDGRLSISVSQDGASVWDDHTLDAAHAALRVEALVSPDGAGMGGVACGSSTGLPRWLWAGTDGQGQWLFGRIIDTRLQVLQRGDLSRDLDWENVTLAIECASAPQDGGDHAVVSADGTPLTTAFDIPVGPYDKATLLVAADLAPVTVRFDDLVVLSGEAYAPAAPGVLPSPAP
jgi:hypothetical protein